jgi:pimeloyl-ACP methyl ester carboxylesterase
MNETAGFPVRSRDVETADGVSIHVEEQGSGRPILLLHGGAGPKSMAGFAAMLAKGAHVIVPTHPGFMRTARPTWLDSVSDLALAYADLLEALDLNDVLVIGQSMGGWIASELGARNCSRIGGIVLVNAVGVFVEGHDIADPFKLSPAELSALAFHDPSRFPIDPSKLGPDELANMAANRAALAIYSAPHMYDPKLLRRLRRVSVPSMVVWGESDRIVDLEYGRAFAAALPNARFEPIAKSAHFPQLEQPERLLELVLNFAS